MIIIKRLRATFNANLYSNPLFASLAPFPPAALFSSACFRKTLVHPRDLKPIYFSRTSCKIERSQDYLFNTILNHPYSKYLAYLYFFILFLFINFHTSYLFLFFLIFNFHCFNFFLNLFILYEIK